MESIEAARLCPVQAGDPPPCPEHFDSRYVLPSHRVKLLEKQNLHPRDERIVFYEEPHIYTIDGHPVQASVSGLPHAFEGAFVASEAIASMKRSRKEKWPRLAYVLGARRVEAAELRTPALMVDAETGATVASCTDSGAEGPVALEALRATATRVPDDYSLYNFDRAKKDEEIEKAWEDNAEDARNRGTEAHLQMELWFNSEPVREEEGEVKVGLDFVRRCLLPIGAKAYRTEWTIFAEEENIAGCIDLAVTLPSGDIFLVDWKRSEKLQQKMYGYRPMKAPLTHLEDCSGCAYSLQLSCYQYILEKYYGKRVVGRALASIHPEKPFTTATPYLRDEAEFLMDRCRAVTEARVFLAAEDENKQFLCSQSKRIVMTAVRDAVTGALYEEKVARVLNKTVVEDPHTTARVKEMVETRARVVKLPVGLPKWRTVFQGPTDDMMHYA